MQMRERPGVASLITLTLLGACRASQADYSESPLAATETCVADTSSERSDPAYDAIARAVPEYAGSHATPTSLTIFLTDLRARERVRAAVGSELRSGWTQEVLPKASFVRVRFSYHQLRSWLKCLTDRSQPSDGHGGPGWFRAAVDPPRNAVYIQVIGDDTRVRLEQLVATLGVPRDAVVLEVLRPGQLVWRVSYPR